MKRLLTALVAGGVSLATAATAAQADSLYETAATNEYPPTGADGRASSSAGVIEDRYIVVYDGTNNGVRAETTEREAELGFESGRRYTSAIDGFAARLTPSQLRELDRDPEVGFVSEDRRVEAAGYVPRVPGEPTPPTGVRRTLAATDTHVREASGVNVAVLDTGIQLDHPDLNAVAGHDCAGSDFPTGDFDQNGHGTHVTGTIAARNNGVVGGTPGGDNEGLTSVVGVAPETKAYGVRVLDAFGRGTTSEVICGIDWVTENASALDIRVANMSIEGPGPPLEPCATTTDAVHKALCNSTAAGVTYVVAAGSDGRAFDLTEPLVTPAAYPEVLTVTAVSDLDGVPGGAGCITPGCAGDDDDIVADFSNYAATPAGRAHTIAAPGVGIKSTWGTYPNDLVYNWLSGTSTAAAHVSGIAALCINEAGTEGPCANLAPAEVITELRSQAQAYNTTYPTYGFLRDPHHSPFPWAYFGFLAVVPGAVPPLFSAPPPGPPPNDNFADAQDLGEAPSAGTFGTNLAASKELGEPNHGGSEGGASVWYRWKAPYSGRFSIDPCAHTATRNSWLALAIYTGDSLGSLTPVAGRELLCATEVFFDATEGVTYHIAYDGSRIRYPDPPVGVPEESEFALRLIAHSPPPSPPPSNEFRFAKLKRDKRKGTAKLTVHVPSAGELELAKTRRVEADEDSAEAAGNEVLSIKVKEKAERKLAQQGKLEVRAKVTYLPTGGTPNTESRRIMLVKR